MRLKICTLISILATMCLSTFSLQAAPILLFSTSNQLTGATGVEVNGQLYDVEFKDGTCFDLFNGCYEGTDSFFWKTSADAETASLSLLDQVFTDATGALLDSEPHRILGCETTISCFAITPFVRYFLHNAVSGVSAFNSHVESGDGTVASHVDINFDLAAEAGQTWAVWSSRSTISEPPLALLMFICLLSMLLMRNTRQGSDLS